MAAYMIALSDMTDDSWVAEYVKTVPAMIASHGGEYIANGFGPTLFEGVMDVPGAITVFRFPTLDAIRTFLESDEYQPYADLRRTGSTVKMLAFESTI